MPVEARELTHTYNADSPFESTALDKVSFTIGGKPAFKFCNSGDQLCFLMDVAYGNPAGITAIENDVQPDRTTYNIMGQRVTDSTRGIVIRNGKKYIVR